MNRALLLVALAWGSAVAQVRFEDILKNVRSGTFGYIAMPGPKATPQRDGYTIHRVPAVRRRPDQCAPWEMLTFTLGGLAPAISMPMRRCTPTQRSCAVS